MCSEGPTSVPAPSVQQSQTETSPCPRLWGAAASQSGQQWARTTRLHGCGLLKVVAEHLSGVSQLLESPILHIKTSGVEAEKDLCLTF